MGALRATLLSLSLAAALPPRGSGASAFAVAPPRPRRTTLADDGGGAAAPLRAFGGGRGRSSGAAKGNLSPLPRGISPFEKSLSKGVDIQGEFRRTAKRAIDAAIGDGVRRIEVEFPPL